MTVELSKRDPDIDLKIAAHPNAVTHAGPVPLTPELIVKLMEEVGTPESNPHRRQGAYMLIGAQAWGYLLAHPELARLIESVARYESLLKGHLGFLLGLEIYSDAFRHPAEKVLPTNVIYVMAGDGSIGFGHEVTL